MYVSFMTVPRSVTIYKEILKITSTAQFIHEFNTVTFDLTVYSVILEGLNSVLSWQKNN